MNIFSELLFARPSFIGGLAKVLDLGNTLTDYNFFSDGVESDARAIAADWKAVGMDIQTALNKYEKDAEGY